MAEIASRIAANLITQGEFAVGRKPDDVIVTILGSCVAVCLWAPEHAMGGMNHILLPGDVPGRLGAQMSGANDMERLINALMKRGLARGDLVAKVFGGAALVAGLSDIGRRNAEFVRSFLDTEGIPLVAESTGGTKARQIRFWPNSGRVQQRFVRSSEVDETPRRANPKPVQEAQSDDILLFGT